MSLAVGTRLGTYEVLASLGAGGMGEVYRAKDTRLGRDVALKILPDAVSGEADRIVRFEREARSLAALNHPHIATLFGMERDGGRHFLVMELVEGETLADRLARGPRPVGETLAIARQMADALETAHEHGIVHRDLKPANVKVTPDDVVKVLDFGLAKALESGPGSTPDLSQSPTLSVMGTGAGIILGTAAYMSPEQAKGLPVDQRSDVFSFGCVLYELLAGKAAFAGDTVTDVLASVVAREPAWEALPQPLDPRLARLLRRCLAKSRRQRWQAIGDVRSEIEFILAEPETVPSTGRAAIAPPRTWWWRLAPIAATALVAAALSGLAAWRLRTVEAKPVTRFSFSYPAGVGPGNPNRRMVAVSPDGANVVFSIPQGISLRSMATGTVRMLAEGRVLNPTFSPDGRSVAFQRDGAVWRAALGGGAPTRLEGPETLQSIGWGDGGILGTTGRAIVRVDPAGGPPETLAEVAGAERVGPPHLLPGGKILLLTIAPGPSPSDWEQAQVVVLPIGSADRRVLVRGAIHAEYVPSGHLLYAQGGIIFAAPFDVDRLQITGEAVPVIEGVLSSTVFTGLAQFSAGADGTLAYVPGRVVGNTGELSFTITNQSGEITSLDLPAARYTTPRFAPDGRSIAFGVDDAAAAIWVYDLSGASSARRLTFEGRNQYPVWSRDGQRIAFQSGREGSAGIYWQRADGTGTAERLTTAAPKVSHVPEAVTPDGRTLLYSAIEGDQATLWSVQWPGGNPQRVGSISSSAPLGAVLSPDGRWLAYGTRTAGGLTMVFLEPYPPTGAKFQVSRSDEDGHHPLWSPDGSRLYYIPGPSSFLAVSVAVRPAPTFGASASMPRGFFAANAPVSVRGHDLSPDGTRFVGMAQTGLLSVSGARITPSIEVVRNWFEELKQRVPTR